MLYFRTAVMPHTLLFSADPMEPRDTQQPARQPYRARCAILCTGTLQHAGLTCGGTAGRLSLS